MQGVNQGVLVPEGPCRKGWGGVGFPGAKIPGREETSKN